jgi:hypothetical protein
LFEDPVHDKGVEDEYDADECLPQPHGRVFVATWRTLLIVRMVVVVFLLT